VRKRGVVLAALLAGLILGALAVVGLRLSNPFAGPDPETVAAASLQSMREQSRLVPFAARFVAVVTSTQSRFGLKAEKTLIMPGLVRYELDLAKLQQDDLAWDEAAKTLTVTLPPLEVSGPEIDLRQIREYSGGGLLLSLTDAETVLDSANRSRGQQELVRQAREPVPMRLARDAAVRAVGRSCALPLRAAGIDANVEVRFADATSEPSFLDRSRPIEDVLNEQKAGR
jgi:ABC-type amino acid transport substrate-binding protein